MVSNRVSSVFFSSVFALLLGACLLLPRNGFTADVGDLNCDDGVDVLDALLVVGIALGLTDAVDCDPPETCAAGDTYCNNANTTWNAGDSTCDSSVDITSNDPSCDWATEVWDGSGNGACVCTAVRDCNDVCGGSAVADECGVCEGDGSSCEADCFSGSYWDYYDSGTCFESSDCCEGTGAHDYGAGICELPGSGCGSVLTQCPLICD